MSNETMAETAWEDVHARIRRGVSNARKARTLQAIADDLGLSRQYLSKRLREGFFPYPQAVHIERWLIKRGHLERYGESPIR